MIKYTFFLNNSPLRRLKRLSKKSLSVSEHIRIAINDYLDKKEREELNVSTSKGGEK